MTGADFKAAGLDKLTPEELARLNEWLQRNGGMAAGAVRRPPEDQRGFENSYAMDRSDIVSRIKGEFRGWGGGTRFELENGQVWVQDDADILAGVRLTNPTVTIRPSLISGWRLQVEGYNAVTKVRRIK